MVAPGRRSRRRCGFDEGCIRNRRGRRVECLGALAVDVGLLVAALYGQYTRKQVVQASILGHCLEAAQQRPFRGFEAFLLHEGPCVVEPLPREARALLGGRRLETRRALRPRGASQQDDSEQREQVSATAAAHPEQPPV
jgi:hypothetical protein